MYYIDSSLDMNMQRIKAYIENYKVRYAPRMKRNKSYYDKKNTGIMERTFADTSKPNNKIATPWARQITTLITGYFIGKPVTIDSVDKEMLEDIEYFNRNNDTITKNQRIEKDASIYGYGVELIYIDSNKEIYTKPIDPIGCIPIYGDNVEEGLLYAIRYYNSTDILDNSEVYYIELYSKDSIKKWKVTNSGEELLSDIPHHFGMIPLNFYFNNSDMTGDFEPVIDLIDGYDLALSDTANFRELLNDSYLVFKNTNLDDDDIATMKTNKVIQIESSLPDTGECDVKWLNRDSNDTEAENYKIRLESDIKKFSFISDIENAKSHTTATSAKIGLMGIEQICAEKESYYRVSLLRRYEMILNILNLTGKVYDINLLTLTFVRNVPMDLTVIGDTVNKLNGIISKKTLLKQIPFVTDIDEELKQIDNENTIKNTKDNTNNNTNEETNNSKSM